MTIVADASAIIAALVDSGSDGQWAQELIESNEIVAPSLLHVECTNVLRRLESSGTINDINASIAYKNLLLLPVTLFPFEPFAPRIWNLRNNLTSYDAWYVAVAEAIEIPLATLDKKLTNSMGPECRFIHPSLATTI